MKLNFTPYFVLLLGLIFFSTTGKAQFFPSDFQNFVFIPYVAIGQNVNDTLNYELFFEPRTHNFDPSGATSGGVKLDTSKSSPYSYEINSRVRTWAIRSTFRWPSAALNMDYLGPTIEWETGSTVRMSVTNNLPSLSPTEPGHGENTTSHWHGLNVPAYGDGGPHQPIPNDPNSPNNHGPLPFRW